MRALLEINLQSRRGLELGDCVERELIERGFELVDAAPFDCIVAAGGDGTLVRCIELAILHGVPLGIVPLGTFNELARTLGIPIDVAAACDVIAHGQSRAIDVSRVNRAYYVSEASIGISSRIARLQTPSDKRRFGFLAIVATALQAFWHSRPIHVEVSFDGRHERFKTIQLTVANSNRFGGLFNVVDASIDDGWLDLYSVEIANAVQAFSIAHAILRGTRNEVPGLRVFRSRRFTVRTRRRHHVVADGEPAGKTPATFEVLPKALRVFVP